MILVTGGTGLVGAHLLYALLQENKSVVAIHRKTSDLQQVKKIFSYYSDNAEQLFSKIQWIEADVTDIPSLEKAFEGISYVYHASALVSFHLKDAKAMQKINIEGTKNIVNLCIDYQIKKLCFVSSIATLGDAPKGKLVDEQCEWDENEKSNYAITKYFAEREVWRASAEGVDIIIVNPGVILGAGFWHKGSGEIFTQIDKGLSFYTQGITGYVDVKDVVRAMVQLMNSPIKNERFVLVSENKSYQEQLNIIADTLQRKRPFVNTPKWASEIHSKTYYSSQKIIDAISFEFTPIETSLKEIGELYLKEK